MRAPVRCDEQAEPTKTTAHRYHGSRNTTPVPQRLALEYVVPLRWPADQDLSEMTEYLARVSGVADVTVVDGSDPAAFRRHGDAWGAFVRHIAPEPYPGRNRKVAGVTTGVLLARHVGVVVADDDVRYETAQLAAVLDRLTAADVIWPQNYFDPLPWHARWDTARIVLNRAFGRDYPGTFGLNRDLFRRTGGYDGDVLFENLQMVRTLCAEGARVDVARDLFVRRLPGTSRTFRGQRVRQAYDDFAQPVRLLWELSWLPVLLASARRSPLALLVVEVGFMGAAELGRRRSGGRKHFPASSALWAPLWTMERALCVWLAVLFRLRGGIPYRGVRLPVAARRVTLPVTPRREPPGGQRRWPCPWPRPGETGASPLIGR
jgi:hypothetical protein